MLIRKKGIAYGSVDFNDYNKTPLQAGDYIVINCDERQRTIQFKRMTGKDPLDEDSYQELHFEKPMLGGYDEQKWNFMWECKIPEIYLSDSLTAFNYYSNLLSMLSALNLETKEVAKEQGQIISGYRSARRKEKYLILCERI